MVQKRFTWQSEPYAFQEAESNTFPHVSGGYAESGRFSDAMQAAQQGIELANSQGNSGLATELQGNVALYREQQAAARPTPNKWQFVTVKRITGSDNGPPAG